MPVYDTKSLEKELKTADVILTHGNSFISKMIRTVTESYWNHSVLYIGKGKIIESDWDGVWIRSLEEKYKDKEIQVYRHRNVKSEDLEKIVAHAKNNEGKKYDYFQLIGLLWFYFTGRKKSKLSIGNKNKFICSELVSEAFHKYGYVIKKGYNYSQISPADIDLSNYFKRIKIK